MRRPTASLVLVVTAFAFPAAAQDLPPGLPPLPPGMGPGGTPSKPVPKVELPAQRDVKVATADKLELAATFWPAKDTGGAGVVLLHMYGSDRSAWAPLVKHLRARSLAVLAIDLRGHGGSAKQGKDDLAPRVQKRDPALFAAMHEDAIAGVRWLVKEGKCDAKRIGIAGASVGCSVAIDAAGRHPEEVASVACMSPGAAYLGLDSLAHEKKLAAAMPLLFFVHRGEIEAGAQKLADARPATRLVVCDDPAPETAGKDRMWAHGTRMFGKIPLAEQTVASFVAATTGSTTEDVVLDGIVATEGPNADPWDRALDLSKPADPHTFRVFRAGRRLVFGGTAPASATALWFEASVGPPDVPFGPTQIVVLDLKTGRREWSWGGMGSLPDLPGIDPETTFGKTLPALRVIRTDAGCTFEGEWVVPAMSDGDGVKLYVECCDEMPKRLEGGGVRAHPDRMTEIPAR